jgi:poly(beta-D-mannuronate) lyase
MKRLLLLPSLLLLGLAVFAGTITVKNISELREADKKAQPGDIIVLSNGEWANTEIRLTCKGTKEKPITFTAQTAGKVLITGHSYLKIGGDYIVIKGLYFQKGYAGDDAVIDFRVNKNLLANNCRVTECAIVDFNNPKRMDENYWISFYGKNNRLDHNTFRDKKNMGVMIAVILDDERSRENFHSIDHNFFDGRPPLASNSGEMIRVGVSQHCQFNSNTQITDNYFEKCDGETEIVSIKSGSNLVKNNVFRECQGGVVLRHGDNNTVTNNQFFGNYKEGTGGVRIINKGQWVVNNLFYACRGIDFRSPLSIMNGIPNSPANRYVQVTDAVIANNSFIDCSAASFCEGSDAERTLPPANVFLVNNMFFNKKDSVIYKTSDNTNGFSFIGNAVSMDIRQKLFPGFQKAALVLPKGVIVPQISTAASTMISTALPDSLQQVATQRIGQRLSGISGFDSRFLIGKKDPATGAAWLAKESTATTSGYTAVNCKTSEEVYKQLERIEPVVITLTGTSYTLDKPFAINKKVEIKSGNTKNIRFITSRMPAVFMVNGGGSLTLRNLFIDGSGVKATSLVCSDTSGSSNHFNFAMYRSGVTNLDRANGCESIFTAHKSTVSDSIVIRDNVFTVNNTNAIMMAEEKDDKGYYNAEKIYITHNNITGQQGVLLNIYRGGNDESTMGPQLSFSHNKITDCRTTDNSSLMQLTGVQQTTIFSNNFSHSNASATLITYKDIVRARHLLEKNILAGSGSIEENGFVVKKENTVN